MKKCYLLMLLMINSCFAANLEKLSVVLDGSPNPNHAPLIIAQQQGFFKKQGLDVQLITPSKSANAEQMIATNQADIGITREPNLIEAIDHKLPLVRIGSLIDKPLSCVVVLETSGIKSIADLKGKKIGVTNDALSNVMLLAMLHKQGLSNKDVQLIDVHHHLSQALLSHRVDAISGSMRNVDAPMLEAANHPVTTFFPEELGVPNYSASVLIANTANKHDARYARFLTAINEAVAYLDEHPAQSWANFAKQYPQANNAVNRKAWFNTVPYFAEDSASLDKSEWENFASFMQQHQLIKSATPADYAIDLEQIA